VGRGGCAWSAGALRLDPTARPERELPLGAVLVGRTRHRLASALRGWTHLRFEVTEEPTSSTEGARYSSTPALGLFHAVMGLHGDLMVPEDRLRAAVLDAGRGGLPLDDAIAQLLGKAWDDELEPFRHAGEGAPVRWLHHVV